MFLNFCSNTFLTVPISQTSAVIRRSSMIQYISNHQSIKNTNLVFQDNRHMLDMFDNYKKRVIFDNDQKMWG